MNLDEYKQSIGDYGRTFGSVIGGRVLDDLRKMFGNRQSHVPGDPYETAFRDGQRSVYLYLLTKIELAQNPEKLSAKLEALREEEEDNA